MTRFCGAPWRPRAGPNPTSSAKTGPSPSWGMDGSWRWDDVQGMGLEERNLSSGFANANTGVLHWDWSRDEIYSLLRRDGSSKQWMSAVSGVDRVCPVMQRRNATEATIPEIALVLPQSLQLSVFGRAGPWRSSRSRPRSV